VWVLWLRSTVDGVFRDVAHEAEVAEKSCGFESGGGFGEVSEQTHFLSDRE